MAAADLKRNQNVIWARCTDPKQLAQVAALDELLRQDADSVRFLCTLPNPDQTSALAAPAGQSSVRQFIFAHRPIAVLWMDGIIDEAVLAPCHAVDLPIIVLEGKAQMVAGLLNGWRPNRTRARLAKLHRVFVNDTQAGATFAHAGVPNTAIKVAGSLDDTNTVLPYREDDRIELAQALGTRPVWLSAATKPEDISVLCAAHREAARRAHRLLLIIAPHKLEDGHEIAQRCRELGWNTAQRSEGTEPDEATQIYIADEPEEMGLWYRIAPITFLGGSFGTGALDDPFHPAALGSVSIHGPAQGAFQHRFKQLTNVNATLPISTPGALGEAVATLLSVDQAAEKANAGWDITSRGAGALALVGATLQQLIDGEGQ